MSWFWSKRTTMRPMEATGLSPERLFELLSPSIVTVECLDTDGQLVQFGSGVVIAPESVVTNKHVVDKGHFRKVKTPRRAWPAEITHLHPDHDLCQLVVNGLNTPPIPLGISSRVRVGERVYAIGSPLGLDLTMSDGLISGLRRLNEEDVIQTSAPISGGSSGGGLFDCEGKLIGITTLVMRRGQNLNFALPAKLIRQLGSYRVDSFGSAMAQAVHAAASPAAAILARLQVGFPEARFAVRVDREQVIHVSWSGFPSEEQVRNYLRELILRRELPNPEFDFERRDL